ncbi:TetR/AcrR family transcriptional regulator [Paraflavitalea soli]|uniref:TetR/AcrR family transcriptional regulator n=1 Tax=Paraflavitalea soli TaxID=2315862 RepID=A0A3B7MJK8_9BACT|nr:TetR/AcrR family transcriptional regulator [Paraflavitalea soli]AXY74622.1 TetR/AcrR family transcriptional regulator [Paraflavitalea soli]
MKPKDEGKIAEIYAATLALVKEQGLAGITMSMIAKKAGFATGTVYIYFANKEELLVKLFDKCIDDYTNNYFAGYNPADPFKVAFHTIWMNMLRYSIEHFDEQVFIEQCFHSPFISDETRKETKDRLMPWRELIERGKKEKLIKQHDASWIMLFVRGGVKDLVKHCTYHQLKITTEFKEAMFEMCWDGIKD